MPRGKKYYPMDMEKVEENEPVTRLQRRFIEEVTSEDDWERLFIRLDIEFGIETLTKMQRECFVMYFIEGYTQKEIGKHHNIAQQTVSDHLFVAREKMKKFLGGYL